MPLVRRRTMKRPTRGLRDNPKGITSRFAEMSVPQLREQLKKLGSSATGDKETLRKRLTARRNYLKKQKLEARGSPSSRGPGGPTGVAAATASMLADAKPKPKSRGRGKKRGPKPGARSVSATATRKGKKARKAPAKKAASRSRRKPGRSPVLRAKIVRPKTARNRGVPSLSRARRTILVQKKAPASKAAVRYMKAHGMHRVNPSVKDVLQSASALLPQVGVGVAAMVGALWLGGKVTEHTAPGKSLAGLPEGVKTYIAPIGTVLGTGVLFTASRMLGGGRMAKYSYPIMLGGLGAAVVQTLFIMKDQAGSSVASKLGLEKSLTANEYVLGEYVLGNAANIFNRPQRIEEYVLGEYTMVGTGNDLESESITPVLLEGADDASPWEPASGILARKMF